MSGAHTFARFFRHSVQAVGVTTPWPLLRLDNCCAALGGSKCPAPPPLPPDPEAPAGVPDDVDDACWPGTDRPEGPEADDDGRDDSPAWTPEPEPEPEREPLGSSMVPALV